jgi:hypothetical protein
MSVVRLFVSEGGLFISNVVLLERMHLSAVVAVVVSTFLWCGVENPWKYCCWSWRRARCLIVMVGVYLPWLVKYSGVCVVAVLVVQLLSTGRVLTNPLIDWCSCSL